MSLVEFNHRLCHLDRGGAQAAEAFMNEGRQALLAFGLNPAHTSVPTVFQQTTDPRIQFVFKELNFCTNGFDRHVGVV